MWRIDVRRLVGERSIQLEANQSLRRIDVVALTLAQRKLRAERQMRFWAKFGWEWQALEEVGPLTSRLIIVRAAAPSLTDKVLWAFSQNFQIVVGWLAIGSVGSALTFVAPPLGIIFLSVFLLAPIVLIVKTWRRGGMFAKAGLTALAIGCLGLLFVGIYRLQTSIADEKARTSREAAMTALQRIRDAQRAAYALKGLLRESGVTKELVIDVRADEFGNVVVKVSNYWLASPDYEQQQMKQVIETALQRVESKPLGLYLVDYLGNPF